MQHVMPAGGCTAYSINPVILYTQHYVLRIRDYTASINIATPDNVCACACVYNI